MASTATITSTITSMAADQKALTPWKKPAKPMGMLGGLAIAVGVAAIGLYMLDWHGHRCDSCGTTWKHLGAFNVGSPEAHSCPSCGTVQFWKDGVAHVFRSTLRSPPQVAWQPSGRWVAPWCKIR